MTTRKPGRKCYAVMRGNRLIVAYPRKNTALFHWLGMAKPSEYHIVRVTVSEMGRRKK